MNKRLYRKSQKIRKKGILVLILFITCLISYGKSTDDSLSFLYNKVTQFGIGIPEFQHSYLSSLDYTGVSMDTRILKFYNAKAGTFRNNLHLNIELLGNDQNTANLIGNRIDYSAGYYHQLVEPFSNFTISAGGYGSVNFHYQLHTQHSNNNTSFLFATNIGVSALMKYSFKIFGTKIQLLNYTRTPLAGIISAPEYASLPYFVHEKEANITEAFTFSSFHNFRQIHNTFSLDIHTNSIMNSNKLGTWRISYILNAYKVDHNDNPMHSFTNTFMIGRIIKIFNY